jgi:benzil reductase ((S)-benzoin forming)
VVSLPGGSGEHAAIVTGVSRGLGAALAAELLERGFTVVGIGRSSNPALVGQQHYEFVHFDLADSAGIDTALAPTLEALNERRPASVCLLNNAAGGSVGVLGRRAASEITAELTVNLVAAVALVNLFCRIFADVHMIRRVISVSSGAAQTPLPGMGVYCVAKAGIEMLTRALAADQQAPSFRAIAVRPGVLDTDMQAHARSQPPDMLPCVELFRGFHRDGQLIAPAVVGSKIVTKLIVGEVQHGRIYSYEEL